MPRTRATARAIADDRRRRHPAAGGYARGDETRSRIIAAALDVFGTHGFGGASTRMLAESAGVTLPALQYYFASKEGRLSRMRGAYRRTTRGVFRPADSRHRRRARV